MRRTEIVLENIENILEEKLKLSTHVSKRKKDEVSKNVYYYCLRKRVSDNVLANGVDDTIRFLKSLNFEMTEIIATISNGPSILHSNKKDMFAKYLILAVLDSTPLKHTRKELLINYPKYYVIGIQTLYSRYKYLDNKRKHDLTN